MTIIAIVGSKGGSGKTTLAVSIAAELKRRGASVLLGDVDPQGSALAWAAQASSNGHEAPTTVRLGEGFHRPGQLSRLAEPFDWTILDTPPHGGTTLRAALSVADIALLPVTPSPLDLWALGDTLQTISEAEAFRPTLRAGLVLNRTARTAVASRARSSLPTTGLPIVGELGARVAFVEAFATGQGVTVYAPGSDAAREVSALVDAISTFGAVKQHVA